MKSQLNGHLPQWAEIVDTFESSAWEWHDLRLVHRESNCVDNRGKRAGGLRNLLLKRFYANHNQSSIVQQLLCSVFDEIGPNDWGLNFGSGRTRLHPRLINLDLTNAEGIDIVNTGTVIPLKTNSVKVVVSQEVFEHVEDPWSIEKEIHRVLLPGGSFYCQVPFVIGYHPGPTDYWRFTKEGLRSLFPDSRWIIEQQGVTVGHGTAAYRILVEYFAVTASVFGDTAYLLTKGAASVVLSPIKLANQLTKYSTQEDRIPGGCFIYVRKKEDGVG